MADTAPKLTLDAIVDVAIDVADCDGLSALSMRRIADDLGVGAMSLYRHVADKTTLLQEMSEEVGRRFPYPVGTDLGWRDRVAVVVDVDWELYRTHPWVVLAFSSPRHSFGPDALRCLDWFAAGFLDLGVDMAEATGMALAVWSYMQGVALVAVGDDLLRLGDPTTEPDGLAQLVHGETTTDLPHLSKLAGVADADALLDPRRRVETGVARLCDGFEAAAVR